MRSYFEKVSQMFLCSHLDEYINKRRQIFETVSSAHMDHFTMICLNDTKVYQSWMKAGLETFEQEKITEIWKLVPPETEKLHKKFVHAMLLADNINRV